MQLVVAARRMGSDSIKFQIFQKPDLNERTYRPIDGKKPTYIQMLVTSKKWEVGDDLKDGLTFDRLTHLQSNI